jgi:hypothetical protein
VPLDANGSQETIPTIAHTVRKGRGTGDQPFMAAIYHDMQVSDHCVMQFSNGLLRGLCANRDIEIHALGIIVAIPT